MTTNNSADKGPEPSDQLLWNIETVILKTGLSRASIYRYIKRERFPPRRRIGPNRVAWVPAEVMSWIEGCPRLGRHQSRLKDDRGAEGHQQAASKCAHGKAGRDCIATPPTQDTNP